MYMHTFPGSARPFTTEIEIADSGLNINVAKLDICSQLAARLYQANSQLGPGREPVGANARTSCITHAYIQHCQVQLSLIASYPWLVQDPLNAPDLQ